MEKLSEQDRLKLKEVMSHVIDNHLSSDECEFLAVVLAAGLDREGDLDDRVSLSSSPISTLYDEYRIITHEDETII